MDSDDDLYNILAKYHPKGVVHCFSSNFNYAMKILELGIILSFTGIITFKNSTLNNVIEKINLSQFMLETDSPYLTPHPLRGKLNEPSYIVHTIDKLSQIKNISKDDVIAYTTNNFKDLFNLN